MNATSEQLKKFHELLTQFSTAMLITFTADKNLHARPMAIAEVTPSNVLWFITDRDSGKTAEIIKDERAHIICQNDNTFLSIQGEALLSHESKKIHALWKAPYRAWFPAGPDDPSIGLIEVRPIRVEYWDNQGVNKLVYLWEAARACFTGKTPELKEEQYGVLT